VVSPSTLEREIAAPDPSENFFSVSAGPNPPVSTDSFFTLWPYTAPVQAKDQDVTQLLLDWSSGKDRALERLIPVVAGELHARAQRYLAREGPGHTLQPTALVNEVYLRLVDQRRVSWQNRAQFFGFAAETMRRILVDHARAQKAWKRGHGASKIPIEEVMGLPEQRCVDIIALDDALKTLATMDPRQSRMVELRFFGGLTIDETAEVLGVGVATVSRDWLAVKAWLHRELRKS